MELKSEKEIKKYEQKVINKVWDTLKEDRETIRTGKIIGKELNWAYIETCDRGALDNNLAFKRYDDVVIYVLEHAGVFSLIVKIRIGKNSFFVTRDGIKISQLSNSKRVFV